MKIFHRTVAVGRQHHAVGEHPIGMPDHDRLDPFHAPPEVRPGQIAEAERGQTEQCVEKLVTTRRPQSRDGEIFASQVEQAAARPLVLMQHPDETRQIGGKLQVDAFHFRVGDHADPRQGGARIYRLAFIQQDRQIRAPAQAKRCGADADTYGAVTSRCSYPRR